MKQYTEPSHADRCELVQKMYNENDEFKEFCERSIRTGRYTLEEFLKTHEAYDNAVYILTRY